MSVGARGCSVDLGVITDAKAIRAARVGRSGEVPKHSHGGGGGGMKTPRLARTLGLDGNPLRRRTDKIEARLAALLLAVFIIGAPLLAVATVGWVGRAVTAEQRVERSWRQVPAVLLQAAPAPPSTGEGTSYSWVRARWITPGGSRRTGQIPVSTRMAAGRAVRLWVDAAGSPADPPLTHRAVLGRETIVAVGAPFAMGIVLMCLAWAGRWELDRRRSADWEAAWSAVGPQWTKRFWSQGQP
jgi:uncharacterized protein DUF3592